MKSLSILIALLLASHCSSQDDDYVSTIVDAVSDLTLPPSGDLPAGIESSDSASNVSGTSGTSSTSSGTAGTYSTGRSTRATNAKVDDETWPTSNDTFEGNENKEPPFEEPSEEPEVSFIPKLSSDTTVVNNQDPATSRSCQLCQCSTLDQHPFVIDCSYKEFEQMFLDTEWPQNTRISAIELNLKDNQFIEILPFPKLPITNLTMNRNRIQAIEKASFKALEQLEYLDLSENELKHSALFKNVFQGPFRANEYEPIPLKTLLLGYNQIHSIEKDAFDHTPYLERLELNNNPLTVIGRSTEMAILSIRKLKILNLAETKLETLPDGFLHTLNSLEVLILSGNQMTSVPAELRRAPHLQFLNLNNNPIEKLDSTSFQGLSSLQQLNISAMEKLRIIDESAFSPLHSLVQLFCSFNPSLRKIHSKAFMGIGSKEEKFIFRELHFRDNAVSYMPRALLPWDELDVIDVQGNPYICDCSAGWMIKGLIPLIEDKSLDLTLDLVCTGPPVFKGKALESLSDNKEIQDCTGSAESWEATTPFWRPSYNNSGFNVSLMIISLFGILVVIGVVGVMALMAVRKRHLREMYDKASGQIVHYMRTNPREPRDDEETIIYRDSVYTENV